MSDDIKNKLRAAYQKAYRAALQAIITSNDDVKALAKKLWRNNMNYWSWRADLIDDLWEDKLAKTLMNVTAPYTMAANTFTNNVRSIYRNYAKAFDMTMSEAREMMKTVQYNQPLFDSLRKIANAMPEGEEKTRLQAIISAPAYQHRVERLEAAEKNAEQVLDAIARREQKITSTVYQSAIEREYSFTADALAQGSPVEAVLRDIKVNMSEEAKAAAETAKKSAEGFTSLTANTEPGILPSFFMPDPAYIEKVQSHDYGGEPFSERIWGHNQKIKEDIRSMLIMNEITGASELDVARDIQERYNTRAFEARRLVRTETAYFRNKVQMDLYKQTGRTFYVYIATKDERVCDVCGVLDGQTFPVSNAMQGINYPTMHPFCRCVTVGVDETEQDIERDIQDMLDSIDAPEGTDPLEYLAEQLEKELTQ